VPKRRWAVFGRCKCFYSNELWLFLFLKKAGVSGASPCRIVRIDRRPDARISGLSIWQKCMVVLVWLKGSVYGACPAILGTKAISDDDSPFLYSSQFFAEFPRRSDNVAIANKLPGNSLSVLGSWMLTGAGCNECAASAGCASWVRTVDAKESHIGWQLTKM